MPRKRPERPLPEDFQEALETGVRAILKNPRASARELAMAVQAGVQLETMRRKSKESDDDTGTGGFFKRRTG